MAEYRVEQVGDGTWRIVDSTGNQLGQYDTQAEARQEARRMNEGDEGAFTDTQRADAARLRDEGSYTDAQRAEASRLNKGETGYGYVTPPGNTFATGRGTYTDHDLLRVLKVAVGGGTEEEQRDARTILQRIEDELGPEPEPEPVEEPRNVA